jgi:hypothetical protein
MAYILVLLFTSPFITKKEFRWFLIFYAFVLLVARETRLLLIDWGWYLTEGKSFFEYYSTVQIVFMIGAGVLLTGWQRIASIAVCFVFSTYNIMIYWFWGMIPINYYDWISLGVVMAQMFILTFDERAIVKNLAMMIIAAVVSVSAARYI